MGSFNDPYASWVHCFSFLLCRYHAQFKFWCAVCISLCFWYSHRCVPPYKISQVTLAIPIINRHLLNMWSQHLLCAVAGELLVYGICWSLLATLVRSTWFAFSAYFNWSYTVSLLVFTAWRPQHFCQRLRPMHRRTFSRLNIYHRDGTLPFGNGR